MALLAPLFVAQAWAAEPVTVRVGTHNGSDRVVFEFPAPTMFTLERQSDSVVLQFSGGGAVPDRAVQTRWIKALTGGDSRATVELQPGAQLRSMRVGRRVVLDVRDGSATPLSSPKFVKPHATVVSRQIPQVSISEKSASELAGDTSDPIAVIASPLAQPLDDTAQVLKSRVAGPVSVIPVVPAGNAQALTPVGASSTTDPAPAGPISIVATAVDTAPETGASAVLLPFSPKVGAAAFRHGTEAWVVFDEPRPMDATSFQDQAAFAGATVQVLPAGTLLRLPLEEGSGIRLSRVDAGWIVTAGPPTSSQPPLLPAVRGDRLLFPVAGSGRVVAVTDSATGQNLEVGTLRGAGPGVPVPFCVPDFNILPSWQGVVVEPLSDRTLVREVPEGVAIETGDPLSPAPNSARALADAAVLTRRFDFPALPVTDLLHRLQGQMADEGAAPAQDRLLPREAAAQTMLSLGLGAEAQSLLRLAADEDPRASSDPDFQGLSGIAALLSHRPAEANGLLDPGLTGSDEISLWRAALAATRQEGSPEAASLFAATVKLVLSYPSALRERLLPLVAETMANGGAPEAADALLEKLPDEPRLALARAIRLQAKGDAAGALRLYNALAVGRDRLLSARAASRAARLRLAIHAIGPAEAADELERGFLDWRGDGRERDLRLEVVNLRAQAGQWRQAFSLLKETAALYPDDTATIKDRTVKLLTALLRGNGVSTISPLDLVSLAEDNAEEAAKAAPDEVTALLADKLVALDLPKRAAPVIERMLTAAPPGSGRATLGARLASMRLAEGDPAKAETALADSEAEGLPPALIEQRGLIAARIRAQRHDVPGATAILSGLDTRAADDLRATILADAGDWRGAEIALTLLAARVIPSTGSLTSEQQDILLRLASAQARAGDDGAARDLGIREASRMVGPRSEMFRLLTAAPIAGLGDLRRSAGEVAMARAIPAGLAAMGSP